MLFNFNFMKKKKKQFNTVVLFAIVIFILRNLKMVFATFSCNSEQHLTRSKSLSIYSQSSYLFICVCEPYLYT